MLSGPGYLDREYAKGRINASVPAIEMRDGINYDLLLQIFAVAAGKKPAALTSWNKEWPFTLQEAQQFADKHKIKLLVHVDANLEPENTVAISKKIFFYRDQKTCDRYIEIWRDKKRNALPAASYHRAMGELMGYPKASIDAFIANSGNEPFHDDTAQIRALLRPAMLDELAKDPVMSPLFPPRQVVQKPR